MNIDVGYGITAFFCAMACLIVGLQVLGTNRFVSREPVVLATLSGAFAAVSSFNWYPDLSESLAFIGIGFSVLAAWAAWKDQAAANALSAGAGALGPQTR